MRYLTIALIVLSTFCATVRAASSQGVRVEYRFDLSSQPRGNAVELWIPYPVSDENQEISDVKITGDFGESAVYVDGGS